MGKIYNDITLLHFKLTGHGVYIKSAVGRTLINMTDVEYNWGDGIKMYIDNYTINEFNRDFPSRESFCRTPSISEPSFPILIHEDLINEVGEKPVGTYCLRVSLNCLSGFVYAQQKCCEP